MAGSCLAASATKSIPKNIPEDKKHAAEQVQKRLKDLEKKQKELHEKAMQVRKQELIALNRLNVIQSNLRSTGVELHHTEHKLHKTEKRIQQCETKLTVTQTQEQILSNQAAARLREIYEGQRLGLLEMLFQVSSLQNLMDLLYYQERIADMDRQLIEELRARQKALSAQKTNLGSEKVKLGDLVSEFSQKFLSLKKSKSQQEQVADKLRTQRAFYEAAEQQLAKESEQLESQILAMVNASKSSKSVTKGSGTMAMPLKASITSPFGWRRHPIFGVRKFHSGVDLAGPNHSPIKAADSGNVLYSGWYGGYGKVVIVSHGNGLATLYAHMSKTNAKPGDNVKKGDVVGYEGSTGFSTGPHLHFEVRVNGKPNNPLNFVRP